MKRERIGRETVSKEMVGRIYGWIRGSRFNVQKRDRYITSIDK